MAERKEKQVSAARVGKPAAQGRRERNKQEKRDRIAEAAKALFGSKGFADTTTQEIAEKADIGTGTLFLYAKTKEDLLVMVFRDEIIAASLGAFRKMPAGLSLVDQLMHVFNAMVAYHNRDTELAKALLKEITILTAPARREDVRMLMKVIYDGIADLIAARQKTGDLRQSVDPQLAAENLFAIYYLSLLGWLGGQTSKSAFIARLKIKLAIAIDGLADPAAPRGKPGRKA